MAGKTQILPTCHEPLPCFAKSGIKCTALSETYPRGVHCPFRKTYATSVVVDGHELTPEDIAAAKAKAEDGGKEAAHVPDFWEMFRYCCER